MIMLTASQSAIAGKAGMDLLQSAMHYHLGEFGVIFIAITLFLFSFSTFLGILFYARSNVAYLFGDKWIWQTLYKVLALVMLFVGKNVLFLSNVLLWARHVFAGTDQF